MTFLPIVIPLQLFSWSMIFSKIRYTLFKIMLESPQDLVVPVETPGGVDRDRRVDGVLTASTTTQIAADQNRGRPRLLWIAHTERLLPFSSGQAAPVGVAL